MILGIDLDLLADLITDSESELQAWIVMLAATLALVLAMAVRAQFHRSPVARLIGKRVKP